MGVFNGWLDFLTPILKLTPTIDNSKIQNFSTPEIFSSPATVKFFRHGSFWRHRKSKTGEFIFSLKFILGTKYRKNFAKKCQKTIVKPKSLSVKCPTSMALVLKQAPGVYRYRSLWVFSQSLLHNSLQSKSHCGILGYIMCCLMNLIPQVLSQCFMYTLLSFLCLHWLFITSNDSHTSTEAIIH